MNCFLWWVYITKLKWHLVYKAQSLFTRREEGPDLKPQKANKNLYIAFGNPSL